MGGASVVSLLMTHTDCCDGTDELGGCKNTCIEKNSAKRDDLKRQIDDYKTSLDRKAQYAASANGVRENVKQRFQLVDTDIEKAEKELQRLTGAFCEGNCLLACSSGNAVAVLKLSLLVLP